MKHKTRTFQDHLKENLKDTEFKKYYQQEGVKLKIAFQITAVSYTHLDVYKRQRCISSSTQVFLTQI